MLKKGQVQTLSIWNATQLILSLHVYYLLFSASTFSIYNRSASSFDIPKNIKTEIFNRQEKHQVTRHFITGTFKVVFSRLNFSVVALPTVPCLAWLLTLLIIIIIIIIQFWSSFIPIKGGGWIYPNLTAISLTPTLYLAQFKASSFSKPTLLLYFSTWVFHIFFGCPRFLLPFTSNSNVFLKTCPSSLLNTCPYHFTLFAFAIWTTVSFNPNISIRASVLFFSISFAPHITLTIVLSVFSKLPFHFPSNTMSHSHIT